MVTLRLPLSPPFNVIQAKLPGIRSSASAQNKSGLKHSSVSNSHQSPSSPSLLFPCANQDVAAIVLGGDGSESRLYPLTERRSEGAIPIAANYRLVDAVISNCINSNINKVYALTQFNSTSLNAHLSRAYSGLGFGKEGLVEVIAACQSPEDDRWFQGPADAVRRCLWILEEHPQTEFLLLPGHHLYKMNYQKIVDAHRKSNADITVAACPGRRNHDPGFGFLKVCPTNQVLEFSLGSSESKLTNITPYKQRQGSRTYNVIQHLNYVSMGVYVISRDIMIKLLREHFPMATDLAGQVIPGALSLGMKVQAYPFDGYWEDMSSIEAYYQANMDCTKRENGGYNFHDRDSPVYTLPRHLPPTVIADAVITDSVIADGCILQRCKIHQTVVGMRTRIGDGATIEDSVIMGSDLCQSEDVQSSGVDGKSGVIPTGIGEDTHIKKAIVDKNARIGNNVKITNEDGVQEGNREEKGYVISNGIIIILRNAIIPDYYTI